MLLFLTITDFKTLKYISCVVNFCLSYYMRKTQKISALHRSIALSFFSASWQKKKCAKYTKNKQFINFKCTQFGVLYCTYCAFSAVKLEVSLEMEEKEKHRIISLRPEEQYICMCVRVLFCCSYTKSRIYSTVCVVELQKNQNIDSLLWDAVSLPQKKTCSRGIQRREAMTPVCYLYSTAVIMHDTFISKTITFIISLLFNTRTTKTYVFLSALLFTFNATKFNWKG